MYNYRLGGNSIILNFINTETLDNINMTDRYTLVDFLRRKPKCNQLC